MTRETKIGLVVSCSFLCLVGLVFYSKLNRLGSGSAGVSVEDALVEAPDAPVAVTENQGDSPLTTNPSGTESPNHSDSESTTVVSTPDGSEKSGNGNGSSGESNRNNDSLNLSNDALHSNNESSHSMNTTKNSPSPSDQQPSYQMPNEEQVQRNHDAASNSSTKFSSSESSSKDNESKDAGNGANLHPIEENKETKNVSKASLSLTLDEQLKQAVKNAAGVSAQTEKSGKNPSEESSEKFSRPTSESATQPASNDTPEKATNSDLKLEPPPIPSHYKGGDPLRSLPDDPPKGPSGSSPSTPPAAGKLGRDPGTKKSVAAPTESAGIKLHVPETVPGSASPRTVGQIQGLTPGVMPSPVLTPPPAGDTAPELHVQLGRPTPVPSTAKQSSQGPREVQPYAPAGFPPVTNPANSVPSKLERGTTPRVESYDEETYTCLPGDTFASISTHYYYTDKYALALLQFNRNHPRAAVGIGQDPPVLQAGQPVYIPPLRILEKQYLSASGEKNPISQVGASAPAVSDPRNPAPLASPAVTIPSGKSWSTPSAERTYQVPEQGEMFLEIARKALGNPDRWGEIYRLNPRYDPKYPVPAGTTLRLPPSSSRPMGGGPGGAPAVPEKKPMPISPEPKVEGGTPNQSR
jgi:hypothetical protein